MTCPHCRNDIRVTGNEPPYCPACRARDAPPEHTPAPWEVAAAWALAAIVLATFVVGLATT